MPKMSGMPLASHRSQPKAPMSQQSLAEMVAAGAKKRGSAYAAYRNNATGDGRKARAPT